MANAPMDLVSLIRSDDAAVRDRDLAAACAGFDAEAVLHQCAALDAFWRRSDNLYHRVRALLFLHVLYRDALPARRSSRLAAPLPEEAMRHLWQRRFSEAIDVFRSHLRSGGESEGVVSGLALAYRELAFQTLADQVRESVRRADRDPWMFEIARASDHPARLVAELRGRGGEAATLCEHTPVRMDLSHSGWSDIFFLGMDHPDGARVLNVSIDLAVRGRDETPRPPITTRLRVIDTPLLRLRSEDLAASVELEKIDACFDFGADHLGLLKAAAVASGLVPPSLEGCGAGMAELLETVVGPGRGLELTSQVHGIPKGSRLAVSTNLLASLIALCMRATGQVARLEGPLDEEDRRRIAARAILGEWLGGSGGGWQDSGGLWPGFKRIVGVRASPGDPEFGISRGRLLPSHELLGRDRIGEAAREALRRSLVLVHGGMAQNVGPILEMVTERYLLRSEPEWSARREAGRLFDELEQALATGDLRRLGRGTTRNFFGPIRTIVPWASNAFTEALIAALREEFAEDFWGFWMLGGMSGGGMGLLFAPESRERAADRTGALLCELKHEFEHALPFAMEPVVYDFSVNETGSVGELSRSATAAAGAGRPPPVANAPEPDGALLERRLREEDFDPRVHEEIRSALLAGRIGLAANRLPTETQICDARSEDLLSAAAPGTEQYRLGEQALAGGEVAAVILAAGSGSRWTQGAGVVKALHPFCRLAGRHRSFLDLHLAKARRLAQLVGTAPGLVFTTSYLTHAPLAARLAREAEHPGPLLLSRGRSIGLRLVPTVRDLRFHWRERARPLLDQQAQKLRESSQEALMAWARQVGEASDYRDNLPAQCLHPVGHWYEVPNLLQSGALLQLMEAQPDLRTLLLHNVDTLGADLDPGWLGLHLSNDATFSFEVMPRQVHDRGGGLARVNDSLRLIESLALPREEDELRLSHYSSMTTWVDVDGLLALFGLVREDLREPDRVREATTAVTRQLPTYVTLKEVKRRWGHGQEDVFPVAQFEKLWGDVSALREARCRYFCVPRVRGQQLKDPDQLDAWWRDGSAAHVASLCSWPQVELPPRESR